MNDKTYLTQVLSDLKLIPDSLKNNIQFYKLPIKIGIETLEFILNNVNSDGFVSFNSKDPVYVELLCNMGIEYKYMYESCSVQFYQITLE